MLSLDHLNLGAIRNLNVVGKLEYLRTLKANGCQLGTEHVSRMLPKLTNRMRRLFLANNNITRPEGWLEFLPRLQQLDLYGNAQFTDPSKAVCRLTAQLDLGETGAKYCDTTDGGGESGSATDRSRTESDN